MRVIPYLKQVLFCTISLYTGLSSSAQQVSFDSSFGQQARTYTQLGSPGGFSSVYKFTTVRPNGSFFMAGDYNQPDTNFFVTKFKSQGPVDSSYGVNGKLYVRRADFSVTQILASGIDSSERFFFVGRTPSPSGPAYFLLRVIRYTAAARVDSGFGTNGIASIPFDNIVNADFRYHVAAYRDGRLLVTCFLGEGPVLSCALVRLKANGTLDSTFASNGKLFLPASTGITTFYSLQLQPDEKIVFTRQFNGSLYLFRYNTNGSIDNGFNQNGMINIDYPVPNNGFQGITILSNNRVLLSAGTGSGYYLYRFKSNGQRDSSFGPSGYVPYNFGFKTYARDFAEQPDGKILSAGVIQDNQPIPNINSLITRTHPNGSIDSSFDNDGVWFFNYGGNPSSGMRHLALLPTAKMLFSGLESGADWTQFVTYRLKEAYQVSAITWGGAATSLYLYDCSSQVRLDWNSSSETNIIQFRVEHSINNIQFNPIALVPANGRPGSNTAYSYLHTTVQPGNNYYRIIAVAANGQEFSFIMPPAFVAAQNTPLFEWLGHEVQPRTGNSCLPGIRLNFRTLRPVISDSVVVEYSTDSISFTVLSKIKVPVPQSQVTVYEYLHNTPAWGKNFYRLRTNGPVSFCISPVYKAVVQDAFQFKVYPVPASEKLYFSQSLPAGSKLSVYDMKGSLVIRKEITASTGELSISALSSGQYIMQVTLFCNERTIRFIKINQ